MGSYLIFYKLQFGRNLGIFLNTTLMSLPHASIISCLVTLTKNSIAKYNILHYTTGLCTCSIIFRFEGPRIKEAWSIVDGLTPAIALGLVKTNF